MRHKYTRFQKIAIAWLKFFTVACFANSVLVIKYGFWDWDGCFFAFLLPFLHVMAFVLFLIGFDAYHRLRGGETVDPDAKYIEENYPDIWKRYRPRDGDTRRLIIPFGPFGYPEASRFIRGKYDDGTDQRLNEIKLRVKLDENLRAGRSF